MGFISNLTGTQKLIGAGVIGGGALIFFVAKGGGGGGGGGSGSMRDEDGNIPITFKSDRTSAAREGMYASGGSGTRQGLGEVADALRDIGNQGGGGGRPKNAEKNLASTVSGLEDRLSSNVERFSKRNQSLQAQISNNAQRDVANADRFSKRLQENFAGDRAGGQQAAKKARRQKRKELERQERRKNQQAAKKEGGN
jgi:hypothetical protein